MREGLVITADNDRRLIEYTFDNMKEALDDGYMSGYRIMPITIDGVEYDKMWADDDFYGKDLPYNYHATIMYEAGREEMEVIDNKLVSTGRPLDHAVLGTVILGKHEWDRSM